VQLPALAESQVAEVAPEPAPGGGAAVAMTSLRIALVEDSDDIRETMRALLELRGHVVFDAANGVDGLALVEAEHPDVALIDLGLPGLDGFGVASALRAAGCSARLVAVSGYGRPEDRARSGEAGFDAHLVKPVDPADLDRILRELAP
jgi:CheY-like chemotaxis protein